MKARSSSIQIGLWMALSAMLLGACSTPAAATPAAATRTAAATPAATAAASATPLPSATPSGAPSGDALHMVVIGDSIPFGGHFCNGCTAFPDLYAYGLQTRTGRPVEVANRSRDDGAQMQDIETQVTSDATLRTEIEGADIVIISVGFNNALADASTGVGCLGDMGTTAEEYIAWALATTPACLKAGIDTYAAQYDRIFSAITDLRKGKPTVYAAINLHDGNLGDPFFEDAPVTPGVKAKIDKWIIAAYERWNPMLCDRAKQHGFACVDVYHAFNGPKGEMPSGAVNTIDGAHPSQAGHHLIADLLAKLDTSAITK